MKLEQLTKLMSRFTRQWKPYTCGTTVFRICIKRFCGIWYSEKTAKELVLTDKYGTYSRDIVRALRQHKLSVCKMSRVTAKTIDAALKQGRWLILGDNDTWINPHVIVVTGTTPLGGYQVVDPMIGFPIVKSKRAVSSSAQHEGFMVGDRISTPKKISKPKQRK